MGQAQRIEVITGVERRRRYTDEEKLRYIEEAMAPGNSMRSVANRHGIDPETASYSRANAAAVRHWELFVKI